MLENLELMDFYPNILNESLSNAIYQWLAKVFTSLDVLPFFSHKNVLWKNNSCVVFAVCFGSLSSSPADWKWFPSKMVLYFAAFIHLSIFTSLPGTATGKHPHTRMLPPPCFIMGMVCFRWRSVLFCLMAEKLNVGLIRPKNLLPLHGVFHMLFGISYLCNYISLYIFVSLALLCQNLFSLLTLKVFEEKHPRWWILFQSAVVFTPISNLLPVIISIAFCPLFFPDVCKNCDHVIARHEYTFSVVDEYQVIMLDLSLQDSSVRCAHCCLNMHFILSRSTPCSACCVEKQRTPSVFYQMTPDSLHPFSRPPASHLQFLDQHVYTAG